MEESWINCFEGHAEDIIYNVQYCNTHTTVCYDETSTETGYGAARNEHFQTYVESHLCRIIMRFADLAWDKQVGTNNITSVNMHFLFLFVFPTYFAF